MDTLTQKYVDVELHPKLTQQTTTETVELLSAEDSIIELGGRARSKPEPVIQWKKNIQSSSASSSLPPQNDGGLRLVAKSASDAWFEVVVVKQQQQQQEEEAAATSERATAIPLAMQVDLGNGSWESSLVPVAEGKEEQQDSVTFDLLLAWL